MRAGKLRHRVLFQELSTQLDSEGDKIELWTAMFGRKIWTEVAPVSGREFIAANSAQSQIIARMKVRYRKEFRPGIRAVYRDIVYKIESVLPDPVSGIHYLTLMASGGVAYSGDESE